MIHREIREIGWKGHTETREIREIGSQGDQ
jgi:hypothetical protein